MKKKLLALFLCLAMLASTLVMLAACSGNKSSTEGEDASGGAAAKVDGAKTLTLWIITENEKTDGKFSPEVQKAMDEVEKAFSKITKSDYKTNVDIRYLTEEEYYAELEKSIVANTNVDELIAKAERALNFYISKMREKINAGEIPYMSNDELTTQFYVDYPEYWPYRDSALFENTGGETVEADRYEKNEWGVPELVYPEAKENQVDIIYLSGKDRFYSYIENGWLAAVDEDLGGVGQLLEDYIAPALLQGIKYNGQTFAIPNNIAIGEYTYMLIDKEMYDEFGYGKGFSSDVTLVDCKDFLNDVAANKNNSASDCYGALPIASTFEETMSHFVWHWNIDYDDNVEDALGNKTVEYYIGNGNLLSPFGALYGNPASATRGNITLGFNNLYKSAEYVNILQTLKGYEINGYYGQEGTPAISYINGDYSVKEAAEKAEKEGKGYTYTIDGREYYVAVAKYPEVGEEELYGNMLAVSSASQNPYACVELIAAINTNPKLRNLLQYGIEEGTVEDVKGNYRIKDDGTLERIALKEGGDEYYSMDILKTGNCFIAHPDPDMGMSADYWEISKKQNGEAVVNPLLGFDFNEQLEITGSAMNINELSQLAMAGEYINSVLDCGLINGEEDLNTRIADLVSRFGSTSLMISQDIYRCTNPECGHEYISAVDECIQCGQTGTVYKYYCPDSECGYYSNDNKNCPQCQNKVVAFNYYMYLDIAKFENNAYDDKTGSAESPYTVYYRWMTDNGYLPA